MPQFSEVEGFDCLKEEQIKKILEPLSIEQQKDLFIYLNENLP